MPRRRSASAQDLVGVASFGFRGEALPAICSVSRLELRHRHRRRCGNGGAGGGRDDRRAWARRPAPRDDHHGLAALLQHARPAEIPAQRAVRVARHRRRRSSPLALTRRDVRLRATTDGREAFLLPPAATLRDRVARHLGKRLRVALRRRRRRHGSHPRAGPGGAPRRRRHVVASRDRDRERARRSRPRRGARRREPRIDRRCRPGCGPRSSSSSPSRPTSSTSTCTRRRRRCASTIAGAWSASIEQAVRRALGDGDSAALARVACSWRRPPGGRRRARRVDASTPPPRRGDGLLAGDAPPRRAAERRTSRRGGCRRRPTRFPSRRSCSSGARTCCTSTTTACPHRPALGARARALRAVPRRMSRGDAPSQRLLFPVTLHLGPADAEAFEADRDLFTAPGLRDRVVRRAHAASCTPCRCRTRASTPCGACARRSPRSPGRAARRSHARHERLAATVACKAAVKAGDALSPAEMQALFRALAATDAAGARRARAVHHRAASRGTSSSAASADVRRPASSAARRPPGSRRSRMRARRGVGARHRQRRLPPGLSRLRHRHRQARRRRPRRACRTRASTSPIPRERYSAAALGASAPTLDRGAQRAGHGARSSSAGRASTSARSSPRSSMRRCWTRIGARRSRPRSTRCLRRNCVAGARRSTRRGRSSAHAAAPRHRDRPAHRAADQRPAPRGAPRARRAPRAIFSSIPGARSPGAIERARGPDARRPAGSTKCAASCSTCPRRPRRGTPRATRSIRRAGRRPVTARRGALRGRDRDPAICQAAADLVPAPAAGADRDAAGSVRRGWSGAGPETWWNAEADA